MRLIIRVGLQSRAVYIFYFFTLSKGRDDAKSFLGYVLSTKLSFRIQFSLASIAYPSKQELWWTEGSCSGVNIITRVAKNTKHANAQKYLRGLGNLCSSVAYNQGRLTLIFNTISCSLQSKAAYYQHIVMYRFKMKNTQISQLKNSKTPDDLNTLITSSVQLTHFR